MSALQPADLAAAVEIFLSVIADELSRGNIVDLGDFGTFWLKVTTEGADTAEEVSADHIKSPKPRFTPDKAFKEVMDTLIFEKGVNQFPTPPQEP